MNIVLIELNSDDSDRRMHFVFLPESTSPVLGECHFIEEGIEVGSLAVAGVRGILPTFAMMFSFPLFFLFFLFFLSFFGVERSKISSL